MCHCDSPVLIHIDEMVPCLLPQNMKIKIAYLFVLGWFLPVWTYRTTHSTHGCSSFQIVISLLRCLHALKSARKKKHYFYNNKWSLCSWYGIWIVCKVCMFRMKKCSMARKWLCSFGRVINWCSVCKKPIRLLKCNKFQNLMQKLIKPN